MTINYLEIKNKIDLLINQIIFSHDLDLDEILNLNNESQDSNYDNSENNKYYTIKKDKKIKICYKNYEKLLSNNEILIEKILFFF